MATIRRLSDDDVRSVFESIHNNRPPPIHLEFQIVPVGSDGLKLSPPSFEFEDGLYILLKPQKRKKNDIEPELPKVPSNLMTHIMEEVPQPNCPWSLSGPQFPQPTAIQQRYCYPKGDVEYSSRKGGALWTMYGADGKEDLDYRLLHVYYSAKRAVNKGYKVDDGTDSISSPPVFKRQKRSLATPTRESDHLLSIPDENSMQFDSNNNSPLPNHFVTPEANDFGRFHPLPTTSPFRPRAMAPWIHQPQDFDSFQLDMEEPTLSELEACWSDTMVPAMFGEDRIQRFASKLDHIHDSIKECILLAAQDQEQGQLVSLVSTWAKQVSLSPLGPTEEAIKIEVV